MKQSSSKMIMGNDDTEGYSSIKKYLKDTE